MSSCEGLGPDFRALGTHQAEQRSVENQGRQQADTGYLCFGQAVSQAGGGPRRGLIQTQSSHKEERRDKRKRLLSLPSAYHQQSRDQEGVSTEPDAEAEMPAVPLKQPLAVPGLLLPFSAVPEAHIFAYLRAKIILLLLSTTKAAAPFCLFE